MALLAVSRGADRDTALALADEVMVEVGALAVSPDNDEKFMDAVLRRLSTLDGTP